MAATANQNVSADEALALAKVRKIKSFYLHVVEYVVIVAFLAILNVFTDSRRLWFARAATPWGLVLTVHGLRVFAKIPFLNGDWERRQVEKYLGRKL